MRGPTRQAPDHRSLGPVLPAPTDTRGAVGHLLQRILKRMRPPRQLLPTVEGWVFILLTLAIAGAALNTGNNLLYLLCALMLAMIVVSGLLSESAIRKIRLARRLPRELVAGQPGTGRLIVHNPRRWLPAVGLQIRDVPGARCDGTASVVTLLMVAPGETAVRELEYLFRRRGQHELKAFEVRTTYPFGLFRKWYRIDAPQEVLVYPELGQRRTGRSRIESGLGAAVGRTRGLDGDYLGLREFNPGDDARLIHWKVSARRGELIAVERSRSDLQTRTVYLLPGGDPTTGQPFRASHEGAVMLAASAIAQLLEEGHEVALVTPGDAFPPGHGGEARRALLGHLAILPIPGTPLPDVPLALRSRLGGRDVVVL